MKELLKTFLILVKVRKINSERHDSTCVEKISTNNVQNVNIPLLHHFSPEWNIFIAHLTNTCS